MKKFYAHYSTLTIEQQEEYKKLREMNYTYIYLQKGKSKSDSKLVGIMKIHLPRIPQSNCWLIGGYIK